MYRFSHTISARLMVAAVLLTAAAAVAQTPAPDASQAPAPAAGPQGPENEWLAKTAKIYYSSAKAGLAGFNCQVRPDWRALFASASKGVVPANEAYLAQLKNIKVKMHGRMQGGSTIEWLAEPGDGQPTNSDINATIDTLHQTVQQMLEGFMQFWSPFMEVTFVPKKADGLEITHGAGSHMIHTKQGTTELTEIFNNSLVLEHFNVSLAGTSIKLAPTFEPTPQGMRVKTFSAEILPAGATPEQTQKMQVRVDYQTVNNQTLPGQLNMDIVGTGSFNFGFDGCSTEGE